MKRVFYLLLLIPFLAGAQNEEGYGILVTSEFTANPTQIQEFEDGLAAHNKRFHNQEIYGARVYQIFSGKKTGKYVLVSGPMTWAEADAMPEQGPEHNIDWNSVLSKANSDSERKFWKVNAAHSNTPKDFTVNKLLIDMYDIKRGQKERVMKQAEKVQKVMSEKYPDVSYVVYSNELPSSRDGQELAVVYFYDDWEWMGHDPEFANSFNEVHGPGSYDNFYVEWEEIITGKESEIWIFRPDLSGLNGEVKVAAGQ